MSHHMLLIVPAIGVGGPVGVWTFAGCYQSIRLLIRTAPLEPIAPSSHFGQLALRLGGLLKGWAALMVAAIVGAAVSDYDHQPHTGLSEILQLFLVVAGALSFWWSISLGVAARRAARQPGARLARAFTPGELVVCCVLGGLLAVYALSEAARCIGALLG
jgi:hypothetical protein